ncbi:MAG: hypothetical protein WBK75_08065 [Acutalibacteraceae bacterium]|jgi:triacylglycerol lipase|nr:hypothetical protein [Clostridiales bacterium]
MKFKTNYPFVMVHGMLGFGKGVMLNDYLLPYWGMLSGDLTAYLKGEGFEVYNPGVGPVSSAWDRACELYAQLVGGTVDYGKAHSEKYGHKRFGRTYSKPVFEGWGAQKKVNLVGHSHGAATIRLLATLMTQGNAQEVEVTPKDEISPLFTGGKADWIYSITTMAGVHEGTTLMYSFKKPVDTIEKMTTYIANFTGGTLAKFWDFQMEQWNLNGFEDGKSTKSPINKDIQKDVIASKDTVYYDVSLMGAKEVNEKIECVDSIYYFSFPCRKTSQKFFTKERQETPMLSMHCCFRPFSKSMGKYKENTFNDIKIDERWLANDGCVPTFSSRAPLKEPSIDVYDAKGKYQKGIWHIYDDTLLDHLQIVGGFLPRTKPVQLRKIYRDHFRLINGLK